MQPLKMLGKSCIQAIKTLWPVSRQEMRLVLQKLGKCLSSPFGRAKNILRIFRDVAKRIKLAEETLALQNRHNELLEHWADIHRFSNAPKGIEGDREPK